MSARGRTTRGFVARAAGWVGLLAALFVVGARALLDALGHGAAWLDDGPRQIVDLVVAATTGALAAVLFIRSQYASPRDVARSLPQVFAWAPVLSAAIAVPLAVPPVLLNSGDWSVTQRVVAPLAACWVPAWALSELLRVVLIRSAAAMTPDSRKPLFRPARATARALVVAMLGAITLTYAVAVVGGVAPDAPPPWELAAASAATALLGVLAATQLLRQATGPLRRFTADLSAESPDDNPLERARVGVAARDARPAARAFEALRKRVATETEAMESALSATRDVAASKSEFLSAVSHELRTPLNSVCGNAQLLLEDHADLSDAQTEDIELILAGGEQLLGLLNDILDMSMIESGQLNFRFAPCRIEVELEQWVRIQRPLAQQRKLQLDLSIDASIPEIVCDRRRIGQAITNLLSNAIKFTEKGRVEARLAFDQRLQRVVIRVIDQGIGIPPEDLGAIFEEYRQTGTRKRRIKGTGLGLAIARSIAQHHGGELRAESELGAGSTFTLSLPVVPPQALQNRAKEDLG